MKKFKGILLSLVLGLSFSLSAFATKLSVRDVDFRFLQRENTVRVDIDLQREQFKSITDRHNSKIEIRFYSAPASNRGSPPRIMKNKDYYLSSAASSYTLSSAEACPSSGKYQAKIWLSVRHQNDKPNNDYETYEESYKYTCRGKALTKLDLTHDFKLEDSDRDGDNDQLNLVLEDDKNQFKDIKGRGYDIEVRLYAERDGRKYRIGKEKTYKMASAKSSFTFKNKTLCGDIHGLFEAIFGKSVSVSCKASVIDRDGDEVDAYDDYECRSEYIVCK